MPPELGLTLFDVLVMAIVALSMLLGFMRGLVAEAFSLGSWVAAFVCARWLARDLGQQLANAGIGEPTFQYLGAFLIVFVAVLVLSGLLRMTISQLLKAVGLSVFDRLLGGVFGAARGAAIVLLLVLAAGLTVLPSQQWWRDARLTPMLEVAALFLRPWLPEVLVQRLHFR